MRISDWSSDVCSSDLLAALVGRRDVGDLRHRRDDGLLERRLRMLAVVDQIEAVGNLARLVRLAVAGSQRRAELALVAVGSLVQEIGRASCRERGCQYV